jgi:hypothetical protein
MDSTGLGSSTNHDLENPKSETRNPKQIQMPKLQNDSSELGFQVLGLRFASVGFRICVLRAAGVGVGSQLLRRT